MGAVDPETIWLKLKKEEIMEIKYIARSASLLSGPNKQI